MDGFLRSLSRCRTVLSASEAISLSSVVSSMPESVRSSSRMLEREPSSGIDDDERVVGTWLVMVDMEGCEYEYEYDMKRTQIIMNQICPRGSKDKRPTPK